MRDERFKELRDGIFQELLKANQHFKIFWGLYAAPKEIADIRNKYRAYFIYSMKAHSDCFCISICNVTKYHPKTSNIPRLINYIHSSKTLQELYSKDEIKDMREKLESHKDLINRLEVARDQYIAHRQLRPRHLGIEIKYKHEEGEKLLGDLNSIFNTLSRNYDVNVFSFNVSPGLNVEQLLSDLNEYHQKEINELKKFIDKSITKEAGHAKR
jgi:hypothetical protein